MRYIIGTTDLKKKNQLINKKTFFPRADLDTKEGLTLAISLLQPGDNQSIKFGETRDA